MKLSSQPSLKFEDTLTWCHFEVIHFFSHDVWTGDADREEKKGSGFVLTSCLASKASHCKWGKPAAPGAGANGEDSETPLCPTTCLRPSASSICTPKAHRAVQHHPQVPPLQGRSVSQACHWYHLQSKCLQKSSSQENPWIRHTNPTKQWFYSNTNHNPTSQPTHSFLLDLITQRRRLINHYPASQPKHSIFLRPNHWTQHNHRNPASQPAHSTCFTPNH